MNLRGITVGRHPPPDRRARDERGHGRPVRLLRDPGGARRVAPALGERGFGRVSSGVQSALVVVAVTALLLTPTISGEDRRPTGSPAWRRRAIVALPVLWHLGLNESVAGSVVVDAPAVMPRRLSLPAWMRRDDEEHRTGYRALRPNFSGARALGVARRSSGCVAGGRDVRLEQPPSAGTNCRPARALPRTHRAAAIAQRLTRRESRSASRVLLHAPDAGAQRTPSHDRRHFGRGRADASIRPAHCEQRRHQASRHHRCRLGSWRCR